MTRDELINKVAQEMGYIDGVNPENYKSLSQVAVETIFDALQDPTDEMFYEAFNDKNVDFVKFWQAMLNSSPLSPS